MPPTYRYEGLDGLRGLAAFVVLVGHGVSLAFPSEPGPLAAVVSWLSRLSVATFFALSGFVIAGSLRALAAEHRARFLVPYAVHRVARILPPLVLAVGLAFAVGAIGRAGLPLADLREPAYEMSLAAFLRGVTLTFATRDATFALDGPLWSLRQEVFLYAVAALLALAWLRRGLVRAVAIAAVSVAMVATLDRFFYPQSAILFGCGAGAALAGGRLMPLARSRLTGPALLLFGALPLLVRPLDAAFLHDMSNGGLFLAYQAALGLPLGLALLGIAGRTARALGRFRGMAAYSYTLYVTHNPILVLAFSLKAAVPGLAGVPAGVTLGVALGLALLFAAGAARIVERPRTVRAVLFAALARCGISVGGRPPAGASAAPPDRSAPAG